MIPQKGIRFIQKKVFQLLHEGKGIDEIKSLIESEGGDENQIHALAEKYVEDYNFLVKESSKKTKKDGSMYLVLGMVFLGGGILIALISYFSSYGTVTFFLWGVIFLGLIFTTIGIINRIK
jgi:hypothetical protein